MASKRIKRSGELKNRLRVEYIKNRQSDLVSKRIEKNVNTAGLLTTAGRKLMLLGINLLLLLKFNAARHKLTTDVEITSPSGGKKDKSYESTIRRDLQLKDDEGVDCLPNATIFEQLTLMGYEKISQKLTFYKAFFSPQWKFLIHTNLQWLSSKTTAWKRFSKHYGQSAIICLATTRSFVQVFLDKKLEGMSNHNRIYVTPSHTKKIFGNMRRVGKGGGPRRQETMGDTIAQTRFENVSKTSNDPLLARGNTLQSCEDCLKLNELMELCTNLQQRVLDLETTKTTQANKIASLKRRVKKLERRNKSRTHRLKRLYRVDGDEVIVENVDAAATTTKTDVEVTLAQELAELKCVKPMAVKDKSKGIMIEEAVVLKLKLIISWLKDCNQEQEELTDEEKARLFVQFLEQIRKHFAAKKAEEKRNRSPTRAQQRSIMCTYLKNMEGWKPKNLKNTSFSNIQELFDKAMKRVNTFVDYKTELVEESSKKAKAEIAQESSSKRAGDEIEQENANLIEVVSDDEEEVEIDAVPLATKPPTIVDWKIHKEGKKSYYQIIRTDGKSQMYRVFSQMLKSFSTEDLEDLYKLVKAKYGSTRPVEDLDLIL
ncbi:hypothetical protein Tco_0664147 [Tanacetum coccineum]